ncbi:acetyltransferase (GNAT) family protein [Novosphingobium sp. PhB165]|uniref:GNAT family N-acetyltransferase n=1 Tax=Novosphingobium sp. PhB165 TaxID=2485105 RepID=UPI0010539E9D|nr:GNAT family N-acetyltransferase [Novosphingobium sp. PhB165]TCM14961.1 acetyltransferase (GNAT) family protein [Novosphingobium sp. PhB165]
MTVTIRALTGSEILAAMDDLARLRIAVFAEWPYLYDGDPGYERDYLAAFAAAPDAVLVAASVDGRIVGLATASPLAAQEEALRIPFEDAGFDVGSLYYFGESVLLPAWRGQGIGHAFFDHREAQARRYGAAAATFAAVIRPEDHPDRPRDYRPLDAFWDKRGYAPVPGLTCALSWKDHRDSEETAKRLQYWMRPL